MIEERLARRHGDAGGQTGLRGVLVRRPMVTAVLYTVVGVLPLYLVSAQAPRLQEELGFGRPEFGIVVASFYLVSSFVSRRMGPAIDRLGATRGLRGGAAVCTVAALGIALAGRHWSLLALFLGVAGLGNALSQLGSNLAVAGEVTPVRQGLAFGLKQGAVPTGALLAGVAVPLVGLDVTWRVHFVAAALLALVALWFVPRFSGERLLGVSVVRAPLRGSLLLLTLAGAIAGGVGNSVASFIVDAGVTAGFSAVEAARLLTLGALTAITMRVLSGWLAGRRGGDGRAELVSVISLGIVGITVLAASQQSSGWFVLGVVLTFAGAWGWPGVIFYAVIRSTTYSAAAATGSVLSGVYLGTVVLPPIVGWVAEHGSYALIFFVEAGLLVVALMAVLTTRRWSTRIHPVAS